MDSPPAHRPRAFAILLATAFLVPTAGLFAVRAVESNRNDVADWLPTTYAETTQLRWFRKHFVADQFVVISWEGCLLGPDGDRRLDDPRIELLARELAEAQMPNSAPGEDAPCFREVTTGRRVLDQLTAEPTGAPLPLALERLKGTLIGPDGRQTCVVATLTDPAVKKMRAVVGRPIRRPLKLRKDIVSPLFLALEEVGIGEQDVRLGGPPIDNVAIDEEGERTLARLAGLAGLFGVGLAYWSLRSVRMTFVVFVCGGMSAALALALVPLTGETMDAILMSMPALVYVLAISGCIHYLNYYSHDMQVHGPAMAAWSAARHAWRPALLCSVTTAIGLVSLTTSDITPIRKFGLYSAMGVMAMLLVLFLMLPAVLHLWPWRRPLGASAEDAGRPDPLRPGGWAACAGFIQRRPTWVLSGCMAVIALLCLGLPRVTTCIDLLKLFSPEAKLITDYVWFEDRLGRLVPMELVVRFPSDSLRERAPQDAPAERLASTYSLLERFELVERVQRAIVADLGPQGEDLVGATMSAATFARPLAKPGNGFRRNSERYIAERELEAHRAEIERTGFLRTDPQTGEELWRVSVRFAAFHGVDHGLLVGKLRDAVEPEFAARQAAAEAVAALAGATGGSPAGRRVALVQSGPADRVTASIAQQLASKRIGVSLLVDLEEAMTLDGVDRLNTADGVVLGAGVSASDAQRLKQFGAKVVASLNESDAPPEDGAGVGVAYTGVIPIVYKAQRALLDSLIQSTWWSFATILPLMMFVCRGVGAGCVVMLPNVLPVLVVFGGMGWLGVPVDIGSMMAASIALGVAVDDTIHFLAWFRDDLAELGDRGLAVVSAYRRSATPTLQAGLINGLGLSVFATSSFTPTQRFGCLMLAILIAGIVAELVMLPALLLGPLGRVFRATPRRAPAGGLDAHPAQNPRPHLQPADLERAGRRAS